MRPDDFLYDAERSLHMRRMPTYIDDPQAYYDYVVSTRWFDNRWPAVKRRNVKVKKSNHACAWGDVTNNLIYLPPWATCDFVLLHEIAHFAECRPLDHGEKFRRAELDLVARFMGPEAGKCLHYAMLAYDLEH
jgi:putative metallohydrolase (TIGR04338 family)